MLPLRPGPPRLEHVLSLNRSSPFTRLVNRFPKYDPLHGSCLLGPLDFFSGKPHRPRGVPHAARARRACTRWRLKFAELSGTDFLESVMIIIIIICPWSQGNHADIHYASFRPLFWLVVVEYLCNREGLLWPISGFFERCRNCCRSSRFVFCNNTFGSVLLRRTRQHSRVVHHRTCHPRVHASCRDITRLARVSADFEDSQLVGHKVKSAQR